MLIGGATALVAVRLLPLPLELFSRFAGRRRGLVGALALRRASRRSNDRLLLTALLTMATVWSFAIASLSYLDRASTASSWQSVGAAYRVSLRDGELPPDFTLASVPDIQKVAYAGELKGHVALQGLQVSVLALDLDDYAAVSAGGWPEGLIPASMLGANRNPSAGPGSATNPSGAPATAQVGPTVISVAPPASSASSGDSVPAIVSTAFAEQESLQQGGTVRVVLNGATVSLSVAEILDSFPTLTQGSVWAVAARDGLGIQLRSPIGPTEAFVRADPSAGAAIEATARYQLPGRLVLMDRYQVEADHRQDPGYVAAVAGLAWVSLAVAIFGALAILAALLLAGAERSREAAHLRILGVTRRQDVLLGILEHGPTAMLMVGAGIALGLALFAFLLPSLGLGVLAAGRSTSACPSSPWTSAWWPAPSASWSQWRSASRPSHSR